MGETMRILHVLTTDSFSGAENVVCQIIQMFWEEPGISMCYCSPDGPIRQALSDRGIDFAPMARFSVAELKRVIREYKPTVIHAHDMRASVTTWFCCGDIPFVSHIHNNNFDSRSITLKALLFRFAAGKAKHIFWVSPSAMASYRFQNVVAGKSSMLRNVIDAGQLRQKAESAPLQDDYDVVFLGRMSEPKNPLRLIAVLAAIAKQEPGFRAAVIGSGELDDQVHAALAASGAADQISMLGFQSNAYGMLHRAKLMIMTSLWEGTPMCALEAMALGVPIVSTPVDGLCDLVEPDVTGYLEATDDGLAAACLKIIRDPALRARLSRNTLDKAAVLLDTGRYKEELMRAYREI